MKTPALVAALAGSLLLVACTKNSAPNADTSVATVNGKTVSKKMFETYAQAVARRPASELTPEQKDQVLDQLILMQLAAAQAEKNAADRNEDVAAQLQLARVNVLSESVIKKYMDEHKTSDAEIKAEYDTQVTALPRQYHARHILVDSKAAASAVIEKLKGGADFARLAEKESSDGSASKGGDLGWFALSSMVPEFGKAVAALDKGKYTLEPVQTQYGWHVIKLEDFRAPEAPPFDQVKDQVAQIVQRKKLQSHFEEMRKGAKIEKTSFAEEAKKAAATPAPAPAAPAPAAPASSELK